MADLNPQQILYLKMHRTLIQLLIDYNKEDIAAMVVDSEWDVEWSGFYPSSIVINLPHQVYFNLEKNTKIKEILEKAIRTISKNQIYDGNGNPCNELPIEYRIKLLDVEDNWQSIAKSLIINNKESNQGNITDKIFEREGKKTLVYNEMKFASHTEIKIARELENKQVLFFPLPLAVCNSTGDMFEDHKEPDFLVILDGTPGILEVSYHEGRYEKDSEKSNWFKHHGILCVQAYTAERCFQEPTLVVEEFLKILKKHNGK